MRAAVGSPPETDVIEPVNPSRRLIVFAGAVFAAESGFYAVVPPQIPRLVSDLHLTTTEVGVLVAAYPAGVLLGAVPSIAMVDRFGVRATTFAGFALLIVATLGFGWGTAGVVLDAARFVQGIGGAVAWSGALAWLTSTTSPGRRGSVIGAAIGAALIGMVVGPAMGAAAAQAGRGLVFSGLAVLLAVLALGAPVSSPASSRTRGSARALLRLLSNRKAAVGNGVLFVVGIVGGTALSLLPLLVARLQGSAATIAWILAVSYLVAALLSAAAGRLSDRVGRLAPTVVGLVIAAVLLPVFPLFTALAPLVIVSIVASAVISSLWTPTAAMITDAADPGASGHAVGVAAMNASWAAGGAAGALLMARLADTAGFGLPFALAGGLCAASALLAPLIYRRVARLVEQA
ncbi:MAG: MFS transporter [Chloroflexi bacterium]|nr:MAG: MFS transporter [Chloroflexota bacterium]